MAGVGTGIGIGIGEALGSIGEGIRDRRKRQTEEREKQADALHTKGMQIAGKLLESGYTTKAQDGQHILVDRKTGQPAQNPPADISQMYNELLSTSKQATALFPPHEANALAQHFRKFLGKQQQPATPDPRAAQQTPEALGAEAPTQKTQWQRDKDFPFKPANGIVYEHQINTLTGEERWQPMPGMKPQDLRPPGTEALSEDEYADAQRVKAGLEPKAAPVKPEKPPKPPTVKEVAGATVITDPNTGTDYGSWNAATAPPEIKSMFEGIEKDKKQKADAAEEKELRKVQAAQESQARVLAHQDEMMAKRLEDAYSRADHAEANAIRKGAETRYNAALSLSAFADEAAANVSAAKDKLLAGRLIRESEGRFNPAQYDNLVKNAGLGNTFAQWMESAETGQLTDKVRAQLVDAAHALLSSAKTAVDALPKDSGVKKDDQVEDLEFGPDGKLRPVKKK